MPSNQTENQTIKGTVYGEVALRGERFQNCHFIHCDFTGTDLSGADFEACQFEQCNFSMTKLSQTGLNTAVFNHCKLIGIDFSRCRSFGLSFSFGDCLVELCNFNHLKLAELVSEDSVMRQCSFGATSLPRAAFRNCDLEGSSFHHVDLTEADFRTARNYIIDPTANTLKGAKFSIQGVLGLLIVFGIKIG